LSPALAKQKPKLTVKKLLSHHIQPSKLLVTSSGKHFPGRTKPAASLIPVLGWIPVGLCLLALGARADSFTFSTGNPDGKIATLSRPASPGKLQTETADDFIVTNTTLINQATFTGLIPAGVTLSSIRQVEIEIYHVFPGDSAFPPSGNVPNRTNSPSDIEIDSATRDSLDGSLRFTASVLNPAFTATNSVLNGIHKSPAQFTAGEGPVTGQEVSVTVTFNPPISLPANHYFFRPEVLLDNGDFLWLSAPKPIVAGTPFLEDLQSWIRNDDLAPDWLRIGTDITHQGPFNASFSLSGETDADNDGIADSLDRCPDTAAGAIVNADGCSIDQLAPCRGPASGGTWKNHGQYVHTVARVTQEFVAEGLIKENQGEAIVSAAARSKCGSRKTR
jgi:hypothetical protein